MLNDAQVCCPCCSPRSLHCGMLGLAETGLLLATVNVEAADADILVIFRCWVPPMRPLQPSLTLIRSTARAKEGAALEFLHCMTYMRQAVLLKLDQK